MALIEKKGYGQVEPNHLSAQRTAQIYAQLPADSEINVIENGMFLYYDMAHNKVAKTGEGEPMLVYNEIKLYDERKQMYKDFAMIKENYVDGVMVPRLLKTNIGDIFTTNLVDCGDKTNFAGLAVEDKLEVKNGVLTYATAPKGMAFQIVKKYNLADGQDAVKVMRIK